MPSQSLEHAPEDGIIGHKLNRHEGQDNNLLLIEDLLGVVHLVVEQLDEERHLLRQLSGDQLAVGERT